MRLVTSFERERKRERKKIRRMDGVRINCCVKFAIRGKEFFFSVEERDYKKVGTGSEK